MLRSVLVLAVAATLAAPGFAHAAAGDLDPSFSGDGKVVTPGGLGHGVAIDSRGRIVVAGVASAGKVTVARYLPDGRLDRSFSRDGRVLFSFAEGSSRGQAVAIDSRDRVIVAGSNTAAGQRRTSDFGLARLTARGKLDPSFSGDGRVVTHVGGELSKDVANSVAIDSGGRIVAAGSSRVGGRTGFTLIRFRAGGRVDRSFSGDGTVRTEFGGHPGSSANSVAIDSSGRIVAAGESNDYSAEPSDRSAVARYLPGGNLDPAFSGDGRQVLSYSGEQLVVMAVAVDDRNKIVLAGGEHVSNNHFVVIRLRPNGALDTSFAGDGKAISFLHGWANSVAIDPGGRIVAAGYASGYRSDPDDPTCCLSFALARYTPRGALDPSFSGDGMVATSIGMGHAWANSVAIDSLGRIVAAGWAERREGRHFAVARYLRR